MENWYVYVIHESPIVEPFYCKVGYSKDPLTRLRNLQDGNPRPLRAIELSRHPTIPFGVRLNSKEHAEYVESNVLARLRGMGICLMSDYNYQTDTAFEREWFMGMHPDEIWKIVIEESQGILLSYDN